MTHNYGLSSISDSLHSVYLIDWMLFVDDATSNGSSSSVTVVVSVVVVVVVVAVIIVVVVIVFKRRKRHSRLVNIIEIALFLYE